MSVATEKKPRDAREVSLQVTISADAAALLTSIASLTRQPTKGRVVEALIFAEAERMGLPLESLGFSAP